VLSCIRRSEPVVLTGPFRSPEGWHEIAGNLEMVLRLEGEKPSGKGPSQATSIQILRYGPGVWKGCEVKRGTLNLEIAPK
jgi:hypothetical protein